mmetsp:Transcript_34108/g.49944  ORF Transcript_34108/g.49944 Transcript_34108/m.49944 type:complete len:346 (-) Transcript_34108:9-1046(-)
MDELCIQKQERHIRFMELQKRRDDILEKEEQRLEQTRIQKEEEEEEGHVNVSMVIDTNSTNANVTISQNATDATSTATTKHQSKTLPPFFIFVTLCTTMRLCLSILLRFFLSSSDNNNIIGGRNRIITGPRQRALQRATRLRARNTRIANHLNAQRIANGERPISLESLELVLSARDFTGEDYDELLQYNEENGPAVGDFLRCIGATEEEIGRCPERVIADESDDLLQMRDIVSDSSSGASSTGSSNTRLEHTEHQQSNGTTTPLNLHETSSTSSLNQPLLRQRKTNHTKKKQQQPQTCAICLESYNVGEKVRTIPCFHTFHTKCIDPWLSTKAECPVCKYPALG